MVANPNFAERLAEVRARAARLRCEAFVDYVPVVLGMELRPVTLASYNRLLAFDNGFAGPRAITVGDILVWVWVHHPDFAQRAASAKGRVFRAVLRALRPALPNLNAFICCMSVFPRWRWLRRFRRETESERRAAVVEQIRHLMAEAMEGFPGRDDDQRKIDEEERELERREEGAPAPIDRFEAPPAVALQAQILNTFRREYGMSYAETEAIPLRRLGQLWREHLWSHDADKTGLKLMDREEAALWAEQLEPKEAARG